MANEVEVDIGLDTKALLESLKAVENSVNQLSKVTGNAMSGVANETEKSSKRTVKAIEDNFSPLKRLGENMVQSFTIGNIAANVITKTIGWLGNKIDETVQDVVQFKRALLEIETILPKNTKLTQALVKSLEDLSVQYGTSAASQAKAYYQIISAGVTDVSDANELLIRSNELATGGLADIAGTIDVLTSVYNVYGKEVISASEASDSLFKTVQLGKTTIPELQSDIGRLLPQAQSFGVSLDEVGASMVQLTNAGIQTRIATSYLSALFTSIARQGKELGPTMNAAAVQTDGFGVVMQRLIDKTGGSSEKLMALLGTSEAVRAVLALSKGGLDKYNQTLAEYSNKAGIAAEASKKIQTQDIGKQWDQFAASISRVTREIGNGLVPVFTDLLRIANSSSTLTKLSDSIPNEQKIIGVRRQIADLNTLLDQGKISQSGYAQAVEKLNEKISVLSNTLPTATNPLITQVSVLRAEAAKLSQEITSSKLSFDVFDKSGPIAATAKTVELENKLKEVNAQIALLEKKDIRPKTDPTETNTVQDSAQVKTLTADLQLLNQQVELYNINKATQANIETQTDPYAAKQASIDAEFEYQAQLILINQQAEDQKAEAKLTALSTEDQINEARLQKQKNLADAQFKITQLNDKREFESKKALKASEDALYQARLTTAGNFLQAGVNLTKQGSTAQKAIMATQATMDTWAGVNRVLADATIPVLAKPAFVASTIALGLSNVAKIAGLSFEQGGIVPGNSYSGDNIQARVNSSEMILNRQQQAQLFRQANGEGGSSDALLGAISSLGDRIEKMNITVVANGRELARLMKEEQKSGFSFA
jgi:TP901 family phage tail tape measure protein